MARPCTTECRVHVLAQFVIFFEASEAENLNIYTCFNYDTKKNLENHCQVYVSIEIQIPLHNFCEFPLCRSCRAKVKKSITLSRKSRAVEFQCYTVNQF